MIFHIDLDSFFVSAERLRDPTLCGKPVAVGGQGARGVISSCSYEARRFGVRSAMPTAQALRLCPALILVEHHFELYSSLSRKVFEILAEYTPVLEAVSIDEAYLDMRGTQSLWGAPHEAAERIRSAVRSRTGLTCSIGIARNRLVAKVATDTCKPDGVRLVAAGTEAEFLAPLPVRALPGVGPSTEKWLEKHGVFRISDLQRMPASLLESLGRTGAWLRESALGEGSTEFHREPKTRSISRETTFERNLTDPEKIESALWELVTDLGCELREELEQGAITARTFRLKLRYPPFETVARSETSDLPHPSDSALFETFRRLLRTHRDETRPLRLLGIGAVLSEAPAQLDLFSTEGLPTRKQLEMDRLRNELRQRFGDRALLTGRDLTKK